ncbi:MAG TPA: hypothetical protein VHA33_11555 [Candidatus Angelobacter sp.]|jgi:hypothetical protein|nr:hypothetical protein [Candidatus Angelobacter sp.]
MAASYWLLAFSQNYLQTTEMTAPTKVSGKATSDRGMATTNYPITKLPIYPMKGRRPRVAVFRAYNPGPLDRVPISVEVYCLVNRLIKAIETFHEKY